MNNGTNDTTHEDDPYNRVLDIMIEATQKVSANGICRQDFLRALVDFTTTVGLATGGEKCVLAFITRMLGCIQNWRAGTFPVKDLDEQSDSGETSANRRLN